MICAEFYHFKSHAEVRDNGAMFQTVGALFFPVSEGTTFNLLDMTVAGDAEDEYMDPCTEYIRRLDPATTVDDGRYTYVSKAWMFDNNICNEDTFEEFKGAVGWWYHDWDPTEEYDFEALVRAKDYEHKVTEAMPLAPGFGFLGNLDGNNLHIYFPNPLALPTK